MGKYNGFWFGVVLALTLIFVVWCFECADATRGYNATGGEVFTIALPLIIVWLRLRRAEQKIKMLKERNQALHRYIQ